MFNLTLVGILFLAAISTSCKKEKTDAVVVYSEENPFQKFLEKTGFNQKETHILYPLNVQTGFSFNTTVKGLIKSVVIKLPQATTTARITIWDANTQVVLKIVNISAITGNVEKIIPIDPFVIEKNKTYLISMSANSFTARKRNDGSVITYPVTIVNINILSANYRLSSEQLYPTSEIYTSFNGDLSFVFLQTNP